MGRAPCCEKIGLKKGPWTPEEDQKLTSYIRENGHESWRVLPKKAGLLRCGKSCRLRWTNYLRPDIKRGEFSPNEEQTIIQLHALLGNKWSAIATQLPKRTDNEIKNYWNTNLRKKLLKMGFDPITHKPNTESTSCNSNLLESPSHSNSSSSVIHMVQWETVRLEAEARLARESKMRAKGLWPPSAPTRPWSSQQASCHVPSSQLEDGDLMSFEQDYNCLMAPLKQMAASEQENSSCTALQNSVELMSTLQNWEKYLQSQAGLMWPDSWGFSNLSSSVEGRESSSCTSPVYKLNHGSPTSSLCSLDQSSKQQLDIQYSTSSQATKISWTNNLLPNPHNPLNSSNDFLKPLPSTKPSQLGDGLQAVSDKISGDISLSSLPSLLQDLIQFDGFSMKRDDDSIVSSTLALDSATDSSKLFGEIDLVSEDICSARSSSAAAGASENHQISYSALLSEEYADCYWNNVLKEVVDSPMQEKIESNESNTIQNNSTIKTFSCSI